MTFIGLILRNIRSRPLRAVLTGFAVAIGVMAVVALGILTSSLKETATQILQVGDADFTISQKHTDDILNSSISQDDIAAIGKVPGVERADRLDARETEKALLQRAHAVGAVIPAVDEGRRAHRARF